MGYLIDSLDKIFENKNIGLRQPITMLLDLEGNSVEVLKAKLKDVKTILHTKAEKARDGGFAQQWLRLNNYYTTVEGIFDILIKEQGDNK